MPVAFLSVHIESVVFVTMHAFICLHIESDAFFFAFISTQCRESTSTCSCFLSLRATRTDLHAVDDAALLLHAALRSLAAHDPVHDDHVDYHFHSGPPGREKGCSKHVNVQILKICKILRMRFNVLMLANSKNGSEKF